MLARVDGHEWETSVWRDKTHGALLAVPKRFRGDKDDGDQVTVELRPRPSAKNEAVRPKRSASKSR